MKADLDDFRTGWYGAFLGLKSTEIDKLIHALQELKRYKTHFHFRSNYEGNGGIGDIEIYYQEDDQPNNMEIEASAEPFRI
jgi:hypothetical protein